MLALAACGPSQPAREAPAREAPAPEAPVAKVEAESKAPVAKAESASKELVREATPTTCPGGRFTVLGKGASGDDGTGLVVDATTGLVWARKSPGVKNHGDAESYCKGRGMRLPTKEEALAITPRNECGWPEGWYTWTSTEAGPGRWWTVYYDGHTFDLDGGSIDDGGDRVVFDTLCVR